MRVSPGSPKKLSITAGAVSHQVKALEAELGIKLFKREGRDAPRSDRRWYWPASCNIRVLAF